MSSRGGFDAKASRLRLYGSEKAIGRFVELARNDSDKALILTYIGQLVADGLAAWKMLADREIEVRLTSGETYLLAETTILRLV